MTNYTPTYGSWETVKNVIGYIKDNFSLFWDVTKNYLPYILVLSALENSTTLIPGLSEEMAALASLPFALLSAWVYICILISWHRVVIRGSHADLTMPFSPKKNDLLFLWFSMTLPLLPTLLAAIPIGIGVAIDLPLLGLLGIPIFLYMIYFITRAMAVLPSLAVDERLSVKQAFKLMEGYFWKFMLTGLLMFAIFIIPYLLFVLVYMILGGIIIALASTIPVLTALATFIVMLPFTILIMPLSHVVGATFLSNYYMHAKANNKTA